MNYKSESDDDRLEEAARDFFYFSHESIYTTDLNGFILAANPRLSEITGYTNEELVGRHTRILKSGLHDANFYKAMWAEMRQYGFWHGQLTNRRKDGSLYTIMATITTVYDEDDKPVRYLSVGSDITPIVEHKNQLEYSAYYDILTGVPNRLLLMDRLRQSVSIANRNNTKLAVLFIDLDGFKEINDNMGHDIGDLFLKELSLRMKNSLRESDTLARLGGDEFIIILNNLIERDSFKVATNKILDICSTPIEIDGLSLQTSASIGVSFHPAEPYVVDIETLIHQADQSMYIAKMQGKNKYHVYDKHADDPVSTRQEMFDQIQPALDRGDFFFEYQPIVNMNTGDMVGVEALIRWDHVTRGILSPSEFLNIIQRTPLGHKVSMWTINEALRQSTIWKESGLNLPINVNLDPTILDQFDFVQKLEAILNKFPTYEKGDIRFEVVETSKLNDGENTVENMKLCKQLGIQFGLDDFGTGFSSLSNVRNPAIDCIKIDRSFVSNIHSNPVDDAIITSIIDLANALSMDIIAEGVESIGQCKKLVHLGCKYAQGYFISKPLHADKLPKWCRDWKLSHPF